MIKIKLKCETADEAQMYLEAPRLRGADGRLMLTGSAMKIKHAEPHRRRTRLAGSG
jgi:hypothetical protein